MELKNPAGQLPLGKMKTRLNPKASVQGNTLVTIVIFGALIGLALFFSLQLITARTKVRARSLAWNQAIPVLESGIEEGLSHLHKDTTTLATNNWTKIGAGSTVTYQKTRTNFDGTFWTATISNVASVPSYNPIIYSQGFVPAPLKQGYISRTVQGFFTNPVVFTKAIASKGTVLLSGSAYVDSFNSGDTNYSTNGKYDSTKRRANGGVVTGSTAHPAVAVGTGHIYGQVDTAPGGTVSIGGGSVGDTNWTTGIESGWTNNDFNFSYPDNLPPSGYKTWASVSSGSYKIGGTNYTFMLGTGNYYNSGSFKVQGGQSLVVTGAATFYSDGDFTVSGSGYIYIALGGSLTLYGGGSSTTFSGGGVVNGTGYAANFTYIGMTNNTTITVSGSADFIGTINAPEADLTDSGSAAINGGAIVNTFSDTGGGAIHYDEGLGGLAPYVLLGYKEL